MTHQNRSGRSHAVVIGASMAGLFTARVLSDHFKQVTLIERDPVQDHPESRKGQPQTRHLHGLLAQGFRAIQDLFPGIDEQLVAGGAIMDDMGAAIRWYHYDGYKVQFPSGLVGLLASRPFLEWHIRRRVVALSNVRLIDRCGVRGPLTADNRQTVLGVVLDGKNGCKERLPADLVVDATGRGSRAPRWLEESGYEPAHEEEIEVGVGYASREYRRGPGELQGARLIFTFPTPPAGKHVGYLLPLEGDRWMVTVAGFAGDHPPSDEAGFNACIRALPTRDIYNVVSRVEPLSEIRTYRFPSSVRRRYEKLRSFPENFLVLGDALASFNPVYGQGMTSAVLQARALDRSLRAARRGSVLWRDFFRQAAGIVDIPWQLAVGEDFRYAETKGPKPLLTDFINRYVERVHRATHSDPQVYGQFLKVMNLMAPPTSLMAPKYLWRVLRPEPFRRLREERT